MKFVTRLPLADNSGERFPESMIQGIIQSLAIRFGGASVEGPHHGIWLHAGQMYDDESMKVEIVTQDDRVSEAREAVREIGRQLGQIQMYFEVIANDGVEFLDT